MSQPLTLQTNPEHQKLFKFLAKAFPECQLKERKGLVWVVARSGWVGARVSWRQGRIEVDPEIPKRSYLLLLVLSFFVSLILSVVIYYLTVAKKQRKLVSEVKEALESFK